MPEKFIKKYLTPVIYDGIATQLMVTFTGGVFLSAFALKMGASNSLIGLIAAIPAASLVFQLPSVILVEKVRHRKAITIISALISRFWLLLIAFIPLFFSGSLGIGLLFAGLVLHSTCSVPAGVSWNSWMHDLIPESILGRFFSRRMFITTFFGLIFSFVSAIFIDIWAKRMPPEYELYGYSFLFCAGFICGVVGLFFLGTTHEPLMETLEEHLTIRELFIIPFKDVNFKNLILFLGTINFSINLAFPFFTVYMLKKLEFEMSLIIGLATISQLVHMVFLRFWGSSTDKFSNKSILKVCTPLLILGILSWTFTTRPDPHLMTLPIVVILHIISGIAVSGVTLASGNIALKLAPKGLATSYITATGLVNSISAFIAPLLGGLTADFFAARQMELSISWITPEKIYTLTTVHFHHWDFFFLLAFLVGLLALHFLSLVHEEGTVQEKIIYSHLVYEIRKKMRTMSTFAGLRQMIQAPFSVHKEHPEDEQIEEAEE